jgi:hypothetical protein
MTGANALGLIGSIIILATLFEMMRRHRLREKYAVIWFLIAIGALLVAVLPSILVNASEALGLQVPTNLLFFMASLVLLILTLQHSYELGRLEEQTRTLAEEVALLRVALEEQRRGRGLPTRDPDETPE